MEMDKIIAEAHALAVREIDKFGSPPLEFLELSLAKARELADNLQADKNIVTLGALLMDCKLGECFHENKLSEHVSRGSLAAQEFLKPFGLPTDVVVKIISCVESHHGRDKYDCLEAEICANADCYRFLTPPGIFRYLVALGERSQDFQTCLSQLEYKMDEKHGALSLEICKKDLEGYYREFKDFIAKSRSV
jgi:HD superfamily phosphodiesterase